MNIYLLGMLLFIMVICIIELLRFALRQIKSPQRAKIRKRLRKYTREAHAAGSDTDILRHRMYSEIPMVNRIIKSLPAVRRLDLLILQGNAPYTPAFYLLLTCVLFVVAGLISTFALKQTMFGLLLGVCAGAAPYLYLQIKKQVRIEKFRRQMPEALDLVARSLKAGHALPSGMKLAAEQFGDPLGPEFSETLDEINFGVSVADALKNLSNRMRCQEVQYFVVAVILQRETGGNLAELMESLARLIRENYKFQGKVRSLSAEGRLSAVVLLALPFLVGGWISISSPAFLEPLTTEPIGRMMLAGAGVLMVMGMIVIKNMIKIDV